MFPCALLDCFDAFKWVSLEVKDENENLLTRFDPKTLENATMLGIDTTKVVLYGTSSGANLVRSNSLSSLSINTNDNSRLRLWH